VPSRIGGCPMKGNDNCLRGALTNTSVTLLSVLSIRHLGYRRFGKIGAVEKPTVARILSPFAVWRIH
jgi:hypothetical protein